MTVSVEGVIVDLDGTLLTIEERFYQVFNDVLVRFRRKGISRRSFLQKFHNNRLYHLPFGQERDNALRTERFWRAFLTSYGQRQYARYSPPINGAREAIRHIRRRGIKIAVITGRACYPSVVMEELRDIGIRRYVDVIVTKATALRSARLDQITSRSAELQEALKRLRLVARRCVFVADYVEDIRSARPLEIVTIAVLTGSSSLALLEREKPDYIIRSIHELPCLMETLLWKTDHKPAKGLSTSLLTRQSFLDRNLLDSLC